MEENTNSGSGNGMNPMIIGAVVVVLLAVAAVVVFGMRGNGEATDNMTDSGDTMLAGEQNMNEDMIGGDAMPGDDGSMMEDEGAMMENVIEVEGGAFYFKPNEIRVKAGEPVTVTLNSVVDSPPDAERKMMHDFVIDELDVQSEEVPEGESTTFTFTPTEPGEYEFYCSVGEHRANGMFGTLIVE